MTLSKVTFGQIAFQVGTGHPVGYSHPTEQYTVL